MIKIVSVASVTIGVAGMALFLTVHHPALGIAQSALRTLIGTMGICCMVFGVAFGRGLSGPKAIRGLAVSLEMLLPASLVALVGCWVGNLPEGFKALFVILNAGVLVLSVWLRVEISTQAREAFLINDDSMFGLCGTLGVGHRGLLFGIWYFLLAWMVLMLMTSVAFSFAYFQIDGSRESRFLALFLWVAVASPNYRAFVSLALKTSRAVKSVLN